jgi:hypothetical protein
VATKEELLVEAEAAGLDVTAEDNKDKIQAALDQHREGQAALGPVVPTGQTAPEPPKASGSAVKGVQPQTLDDVPEGLR